MRTKEEWNALKEEVETLNKKLAELSDEELDQVNGGMASAVAADQARGQTVDKALFPLTWREGFSDTTKNKNPL